MPTKPTSAPSRPISALLSQILVAYTVEFDNEFERRMSLAGHPGAGLSLYLYYTVMRHLNENGISVQDLAGQSIAVADAIRFQLGCLERWRFLTLQPDTTDRRPVPRALHRRAGRELRAGWGSGRGIRGQWIVHLTSRGRNAVAIWPLLFDEIEQRWQNRFGAEIINEFRTALSTIVSQLNPTANNALPAKPQTAAKLSLPALLSRLLMAFAHEFNRQSRVPLGLSANTLRVLGETAISERDIPRLTGCSPETSGVGWQLKPFIVVEPDKNARGKMVRLNGRGLAAQASYAQLVQNIEKDWEQRLGATNLCKLRQNLERFFALRNSDGLLLSQGLRAPEGSRRAGHQVASLGAGQVGVAARKRTRDMIQQTAEFICDPANALPHFPLWDMNRGFGP